MTSESGETAVEQPQRRRSLRVDVRISRQALKVVTPTNEEIGPWQRRAAWLLALAERRSARGKRDPKLADEAATLLAAVKKRQKSLMASLEALPEDVARSSRLEDTARALDSVATVLGTVRTLMSAERRLPPSG